MTRYVEMLSSDKHVQRARQLLEDHLDRWQLRSYRQRGTFIVRGSEGGRYRITGSPHGMVHPLLTSRNHFTSVRQAFIPSTYDSRSGRDVRYPAPDQQLALKLLIESNEDEFLEMSCTRSASAEDHAAARGQGAYANPW